MNPERERAALVGRIAAGLAHDMNAPIGVVLGFTGLAREMLETRSAAGLSPEDTGKLGDYLDLIDKSALRARTLTQEIWEFAKTESGSPAEFDVEAALRHAARLAAPALRSDGVEVPDETGVVEPGPDAGCELTVRADRVLCLQAFVGLMLEAPVSLPSGGRIQWSARRDSNGAVRVDFLAKGWEGPAPAAWTVPEHARVLMSMQGGVIAEGQNAGEAIARLPRAGGEGVVSS